MNKQIQTTITQRLFEQVYPEAARFLQALIRSNGGADIRTGQHNGLQCAFIKVRNLDRYSVCPCESGKKVKFCHPELASPRYTLIFPSQQPIEQQDNEKPSTESVQPAEGNSSTAGDTTTTSSCAISDVDQSN